MSDPSKLVLKPLTGNAAGGASMFDNVAADLGLLATMVEMGLDKTKSERSLIATKNKGIQQAIDWYYSHGDEEVFAAPAPAPAPAPTAATTASSSSFAAPAPTPTPTPALSSPSAASAIAPNMDESGRLYISTDDSFRAPGKLRGFTDKERIEFAEKQRKMHAEELKKEKMAKKMELDRLRKQMELEKKERAERLKGKMVASNNNNNNNNNATVAASPSSTPSAAAAAAAAGSDCLLQIRLIDGSTVKNTFKSTDTIEQVHNFVAERSGLDPRSFTLMCQYPRKEFTGETFPQTLQEASLCPRAQLIVQATENKGVVRRGEGSFPSTSSAGRYPYPYPGGGGTFGGGPGGMPMGGSGPRYYDDDDDDNHDSDGDDYYIGGAGRRVGGGGDDYERLLALGERIGNVSTGISFEDLARLPVHIYGKHTPESAELEYETSQRCVICMCDYAQNEEMCTLPCNHSFHKACIYSWVKDKNVCPYCKKLIVVRRH